MKDIFEDPNGWARKAAGTPLRMLLLIAVHITFLVLGFLLDQAVFFAIGGLALPALYLYAMYRLSQST